MTPSTPACLCVGKPKRCGRCGLIAAAERARAAQAQPDPGPTTGPTTGEAGLRAPPTPRIRG